MLCRRIVALVLLLIVILLTIITLRIRPVAFQRHRVSASKHFGLVSVDTLQRRITLPAEVIRDSGHALILVNLTGYRWLNDSAAITSPAALIHLQEALARLDWAFWDSLWTGLQPQRTATVSFRLSDTLARLSGLLAETLSLSEAVFTGIPELDGIVLHSHAGSDCVSCPAFALEQPLVIGAIRHRARSFDLKTGTLPARGTKLTVVIQLPVKEP